MENIGINTISKLLYWNSAEFAVFGHRQDLSSSQCDYWGKYGGGGRGGGGGGGGGGRGGEEGAGRGRGVERNNIIE